MDHPSLCTLGLAVFALSSILPAQNNLLKNGDFETGQLTPWTESGYRLSAQVSQHNVAGSGSSLNFNCLHGGRSGQTRKPNGYWPGNSIEQNVLQIQTIEYLFTADVLVENVQSPPTGNADAGMVEVFSDGKSVGSFDFGRYTGNTAHRERVCFTYKATSTGTKAIRIEFSRKYYSSTRTPTIFIDNITLVQSPTRPLICPRGERKINTQVKIELEGAPSAQFALFVALQKLPNGVSVGGFGGSWWMQGLLLQVTSGKFDASGNFTFGPTLPNDPGLAGFPLHWQAIEAGTVVNMGEPASFSFY